MSIIFDFHSGRERATGNWQRLLSALGIEVTLNRHTACPGCGGRDRFRFDDKQGRGTWICSQGGGDIVAGDGFELIRHVRGCSAQEALRAVAEVVGIRVLAPAIKLPQKPAAPSVGQRVKALRMWDQVDRSDEAVTCLRYAIEKKLQHAFGAGRLGDQLVVPIRAHGTGDVIAVQTIDPDGRKLTYGSMTAPDGTPGYLILGNEQDLQAPRYVCEGWATGVAIAFTVLKGNACVAISFGKARLEKVAYQFQSDIPRGQELLLAEDNDAMD